MIFFLILVLFFIVTSFIAITIKNSFDFSNLIEENIKNKKYFNDKIDELNYIRQIDKEIAKWNFERVSGGYNYKWNFISCLYWDSEWLKKILDKMILFNEIEEKLKKNNKKK